MTPLQAARQNGHVAVETVLRQHGAHALRVARSPWWLRWLPGL
jgi:hypothetical protein